MVVNRDFTVSDFFFLGEGVAFGGETMDILQFFCSAFRIIYEINY